MYTKTSLKTYKINVDFLYNALNIMVELFIIILEIVIVKYSAYHIVILDPLFLKIDQCLVSH